MQTDTPLKVLYERYAKDLLPLTGDAGAAVRRSAPVEIKALERRVDCVLALEREGESYYRHLEFQAAPDPEMATRCFRYNTQLVLHYNAPVLTTVLYLFPPKPRQPPVFRVLLAGREVNRWGFEEDPAVLEEAVSRIERAFPQERLPEAEDVLLALASRYYTVSELARIVGRDR